MEPYDLLDRLYLASFFPVYAGTDRAGGDRPVRILNLQESLLSSNLNGIWKSAIQPLHLNHRHVVSTYPPYEPKGWIVTERVAGHLGGAPFGCLKPDQARTLLRQMLDALEQYHAAGLIHGGVCPEAFLIDEKRFAKLDYSPGLLINGEVSQRLAHHEFTPPETINPSLGQIGFQADIYSLGMSIAALLVGPDFNSFFPVDAQNLETFRVSWMSWHARAGESLDSVGILSKIPAPLRPILSSMTAKQVSDRPASTSEISKLLENVPDVLIDLPEVSSAISPQATTATRLDQVDNSLGRRPNADRSNAVSSDKPKKSNILLPTVMMAVLASFLGVLGLTQYSRWGNRPPTAKPDTIQVIEAGTNNEAVSNSDSKNNVLENDTDDDKADTSTVSGVQHGSQISTSGHVSEGVRGDYGTLVINADGSSNFALDDSLQKVNSLRDKEDTLTDVFSYTVSDRRGKTSTTQVTVTILGANDGPVAVVDSADAKEAGGSLNSLAGAEAAGNVFLNDTDPDDGDSLEVIGVKQGEQAPNVEGVSSHLPGSFGTLILNADGSFTYRVDDNNPTVQSLWSKGEKRVDLFSYLIRDKSGITSSSQIKISIEGADDAPIAVPDTVTVIVTGGRSDAPQVLTEGNVLKNDSDVDAKKELTVVDARPSTLQSTSNERLDEVQGKFGRLTLKPDGDFSYRVDSSGELVKSLYQGDEPLSDSFAYTIRDSTGLETSGQLTVAIQSNRPKLKYFAALPPKLRTRLTIEKLGKQVVLDEQGRIEVQPNERLRIFGPGYKSEEVALPEDLDPAVPWPITPTADLPEGYKAAPRSAINVETGYPEEIFFDDPKLEADSPLRLRLVGADVDDSFGFEVGVKNPTRPGEELPLFRQELARPIYVSIREITNYQVKRLEYLKREVDEQPEPNDFNRSPARNTVLSAAQKRCAELFGGRLPTEAEWELAARGARQRAYPYPWGEGEKRVSLFATERDDAELLSRELLDQSTWSEDISPYGLRNLLDNLAEWCIAEGGKPVIRGCSINDDVPRTIKLATRPEILITRRQDGNVVESADWVGYRLVLDTRLEFRRGSEKENSDPKE